MLIFRHKHCVISINGGQSVDCPADSGRTNGDHDEPVAFTKWYFGIFIKVPKG